MYEEGKIITTKNDFIEKIYTKIVSVFVIPSQKHSSWIKNGGHLLSNADNDTCAIMMSKRLDETFNVECANQFIVERW